MDTASAVSRLLLATQDVPLTTEGWCSILDKQCGSRGKILATEMSVTFEENNSVALSEPVDQDSLVNSISKILVTFFGCVLAISAEAKTFYSNMQQILANLAGSDAEISAQTALLKEQWFLASRAASTRVATTCNNSYVNTVLESEMDDFIGNFFGGLNLLPDHQPDNWPSYNNAPAGMEAGLYCLVLAELGAFLRCCSPVAQVLSLRMLEFLEAGSIQANILFQQEHAEIFGLASQLLNSFSFGTSDTLSGFSNLPRVYLNGCYLTTAAISVLAGLSTSVQLQGLELSRRNLVPAAPVPTPTLKHEDDMVSTLADLVDVVVKHAVDETVHTMSRTWNLQIPGMPEKSLASFSDAFRFVDSMCRDSKSVYRMPSEHADQRDWQAWFAEIRNLKRLFPSLPEQLVIQQLRGRTPVDDRRIFGWHEKTLASEQLGVQPTLEHFLQHVEQQIVRVGTTRRDAYTELQQLSKNFMQLEDCMVLCNRLKQLYQQMYPLQSDLSHELEPCTCLQAIRMVHEMLHKIRIRGNARSSPLVKAWKDFDYNHTLMFNTYIDEKLHTPCGTSVLSNQYMVEVCTQLEQAHRMFVQMASVRTNTNSSEQINNGNLVAAQFSTKDAGRKRSGRNSELQSPSKRGRGTSRGGGRGGRGGGRGGSGDRSPSENRNTAAASSSTDVIPGIVKAVKLLASRHPELAPPAIRKEHGLKPQLSAEECIARIAKGGCVLCQESHQHWKCSLRKNMGETSVVKRFISAYAEIRSEQKAAK